MDGSFANFISGRCEKKMNGNTEYNGLKDRCISLFNRVYAALPQEEKDCLIEYESTVTRVNDIMAQCMCEVVLTKDF
jgi:hypothetical protein